MLAKAGETCGSRTALFFKCPIQQCYNSALETKGYWFVCDILIYCNCNGSLSQVLYIKFFFINLCDMLCLINLFMVWSFNLKLKWQVAYTGQLHVVTVESCVIIINVLLYSISMMLMWSRGGQCMGWAISGSERPKTIWMTDAFMMVKNGTSTHFFKFYNKQRAWQLSWWAGFPLNHVSAS